MGESIKKHKLHELNVEFDVYAPVDPIYLTMV